LRIEELEKLYFNLADCIAKESYSPEHLKFLARRQRQQLQSLKARLTVENIKDIVKANLHKQEVGAPGMFVYFCDREDRDKLARALIKELGEG